mmetsp:Transcript_36336/g.113806  ORF Transcript_36336/g.113806 Transcript_36336/m.113806 type:complete len:281 (-) Transcript_36336:184-1026(-)
MVARTFDVSYSSASIELIPRDALFAGTPGAPIRLTLTNYVPLLLMAGTAAVYWVLLVPRLFPALRPKTDAERARWTRTRDAWNLLLFLFSACCCSTAALTLWQDGQLFRSGAWEALHCRPVEGTRLRAVSSLFTLSKLWEWGDTLFLIALGQKPPEFLHLYHHATTFWLFCLVMNMPGPEKFGLLLNGGVHTLMYSHYWKPWPKPLVPVITVAQIFQLAFVTYSWTINPGLCATASFANAPSALPVAFATPYAMVPVYLYFFLLFFARRFLGVGGKRKRQ